MTAKLIIKKVKRFAADIPAEEIDFEPGVNVLVGPRNAGKTTWLRLIDHAFGDPDTAIKALGAPIAEKYDAVEVTINIGDADHVIGRNWKEKNAKTKIVINGQSLDVKEFNDFIFQKLGWPQIVYASGDPYAERAWKQLGFRGPFRHMFRQARFWGDFVEQQPGADFYACMMLFLGLAEKRYPPEHGDIVKANKEIERLTYKKENMVEMLTQVSHRLGSAKDVGNTPTIETLDKAITHYQNEMVRISETNKVLLLTTAKNVEPAPDLSDSLQKQWTEASNKRTVLKTDTERNRERWREIESYRRGVSQERERLERTLAAGELLVGIKITHCPACDQTVDANLDLEDQCYLCHQPHYVEDATKINTRRLEFEKAQLEEELSEIAGMANILETQYTQLMEQTRAVDIELQDISRKLAPLRTAVAAVMPVEVTLADRAIGALGERIKLLEGLKDSLQQRDNINQEITELEEQITLLRTKVTAAGEGLSFTIPAQRLTDGFNSYLNALNKEFERYDKALHGNVKITKSDVKVTIQDLPWQHKLGDTNTGYFVLAYNYALLKLSQYPEYLYPGLEIIDFPMTFADGKETEDAENYLIEPFCDLQKLSDKVNWQVIVAGRSFKDLNIAHRIELHETWK
ncbi:MAG: hypothetical protein Q8T09_00700 [Candidatus Melainabacteria bacterium]|nr:hypothetical protein [Candidatus Melainabacteria bacterium]